MDTLATKTLPVLYARIPTTKIAFLKYILEGYDGLAVMSTVSRESGMIKIMYSHGSLSMINELLDNLADQLEAPAGR